MPGSSGHFVFAYGGLPAGRGVNVGKGRSFSRAVVPLCLRLWSPGGPSHFVGPFPFREPTPPGATIHPTNPSILASNDLPVNHLRG